MKISHKRTCPEIDEDIDKEENVRATAVAEPNLTTVTKVEGNCNGKADEIRHQKNEHCYIPVDSKRRQNRCEQRKAKDIIDNAVKGPTAAPPNFQITLAV